MALQITSLADLRKYYETRKEMAQKQRPLDVHNRLLYPSATGNVDGMVYAWEEAIKGLAALCEHEVCPMCGKSRPCNCHQPESGV